MLDQGTFALNSRKINRANLLAIKPFPFFIVEVHEKFLNLFGTFEVDKRVADVALILRL
jgi:hypothetical protein